MKQGANFPNHSLCQGENLDFLRMMNSGCVDLIATDPPFNSGRDYFADPNSISKGAYFPDKWAWSNEMRVQHLNELEEINPRAHHYVSGVWRTLGDGALTSFLLFMSLRLVEMHRVLKPTGSIYLHCDHHASHYLKQLMDVLFGINNFQNEIIWSYRTGGASKKRFGRKHDVILFYTKGNKYIFNLQKEKAYTKSESRKPGVVNYGAGEAEFFEDGYGVYNLVNMRDVWEISYINSQSEERKGYPTQKPVALYERIVKTSSNEGNVVLDPFCGCATTLVAAENLGRKWIGIDIHPETRRIVANRIAEACNLSSPDGSVPAQLNHLDIERDLDIYIFTKEDFPPRTK